MSHPSRKEILKMLETAQISAAEAYGLLKKIEAGHALDEKPLYFGEEWIISEADSSEVTEQGTIMVMDLGAGIGHEFKRSASNKGLHVVLAVPGQSFSEGEGGIYEFEITSPDCFTMLFESLKKKGSVPEKIIIIYPDGQGALPDTINESLDRGIYGLFKTIKAIMTQKTKAVKLLCVYGGNTTSQNPCYAALSGFAKTLFMENPKYTCKVLEVPDISNVEFVFEKAITELSLKNVMEFEVKYSDKCRMVKTIKEIEKTECKSLPIKEDGVYLITGGTGGLGLIFAQYLAEKYKARLVLTGRSALTDEKKVAMTKLENCGAKVQYIKADVTSRESVNKLVESVKSSFGCINGVIHSAGVIRDAFIIKKTLEDMKAVISPKVYGTMWLDEATRSENIDFFVLFSSASSATGNMGQCDYAFGNSFMDNYAVMRSINNPNSVSLSINWPYWKEGGMRLGEETIAMMKKISGIIPLLTDEGIRAFEYGLCCSPALSRLIVLKGEAGRIKNSLGIKTEKQEELKQTIKENQPAPAVANTNIAAGEDEKWILKEKTEAFLKEILSKQINLSVDRIDSVEPLERYGIDSVIIMGLNSELEGHFGKLSKTLFFEYQSISELAEYFMEKHSDKLYLKFGGLKKTEDREQAVIIGDFTGTETQSRFQSRGRNRFAGVGQTKKKDDEDIAIIGISGRYPMAANLEEFWENIKAGKDCVTEIPKDRWDYNDYFDTEKGKPGKNYCKWGGFIDNVDCFDPLFFNISPREAEYMDPQERIFLETVWHTIEDAGYTRATLGSNVGVFVGAMYAHYQFFGVEESAKGNITTISSMLSSIANRVSYFFNFQGPSIALDTMCSSSLTSIHLACESLRRGEIAVAVAGGVNTSLHPYKYNVLSHGTFISSDGKCRSFGEGGDGYVPGEGVGAVLLKPLPKAVADGDNIYVVIKGSSVNHGGKTNGFMVPNPNAQANLIGATLKKTGINPRTISCIEAQATGTPLGDPLEIAGLSKAYGEYTSEKQFCCIGSVKGNIGHLEAASGMAGLSKLILQIKHKMTVPSINSEKLNPNINFKDSPFYIQHELEEWKQPVITENGIAKKYPRRAGLNAFGAGGSNAHFILEEYEAPKGSKYVSGVEQIVVLSAKSKEVLKDYARRLSEFLTKNAPQYNEGWISNIAYTLQTGREAMEFRAAFIVSDINELCIKLVSFINDTDEPGIYKNGSEKPQMSFGNPDEAFIKAAILSKDIQTIALLWVSGIELDWKLLYKNGTPQKTPLPVYPFLRTHYHLPEPECRVEKSSKPSLDSQKKVKTAEPEREKHFTDELIPFENQVESVLRQIISKLLKLPEEQIGVDENLKIFGFDSLSGMKLANIIQDYFGSKIPVKSLFEFNSIKDIAGYLIKEKIIVPESTEEKPMSSVEERDSSDRKILKFILEGLSEGSITTEQAMELDSQKIKAAER
ncbi:SDR family NAD(P)-dependent oxidoreductase [Ruminiclostridium cellulolyticum]|uniref:Beta-ketoacyl synthase n=1 Tax=Ruminiclostridium cellulolyticum (strain ATCC 35319 / DSM 5812 / JCM 6584 / H10) TaxID=394503 RepID=B8I8K2_RUMCH|nr:SDR family NAD(P)-dependent oxidoreductase [Ruminiclostridium cellulolyticum]ACL75235.1 Beta-ketoacyl synthase [Ruminiclostridium cellulolyticum H10]